MTIEARLTREYGILFIDARSLVLQARLELGIQGYPTSEEEELLFKMAGKIFEAKPESTKDQMRQMNHDLSVVKSSHSTNHDDNLDSSDHTASTMASTSSFGSLGAMKKTRSMGALRRDRSKRNIKPDFVPPSSKNAVFDTKDLSSSSHSAGGRTGRGPKRSANLRGCLQKSNSISVLQPRRLRGAKSAMIPLSEVYTRQNSRSRVSRLGTILDIKVPM